MSETARSYDVYSDLQDLGQRFLAILRTCCACSLNGPALYCMVATRISRSTADSKSAIDPPSLQSTSDLADRIAKTAVRLTDTFRKKLKPTVNRHPTGTSLGTRLSMALLRGKDDKNEIAVVVKPTKLVPKSQVMVTGRPAFATTLNFEREVSGTTFKVSATEATFKDLIGGGFSNYAGAGVAAKRTDGACRDGRRRHRHGWRLQGASTVFASGRKAGSHVIVGWAPSGDTGLLARQAFRLSPSSRAGWLTTELAHDFGGNLTKGKASVKQVQLACVSILSPSVQALQRHKLCSQQLCWAAARMLPAS